MPGHVRVGVGRDDGASGGEHCAIFFDRDRFQHIDEGTFWLEEPTDRPASWRFWQLTGPKRICTWVRLRDRRTGRTFRVYNTHLYLTERSRQRAVRLILAQIAQSDRAEPILLAGDFNATEKAPSRRLFAQAGLESTAAIAAQQPRPTYQFYGIPLRSLDEILAGPQWEVHAHEVLNVKPGNRYPSDHFGVMVDLTLTAGSRTGPVVLGPEAPEQLFDQGRATGGVRHDHCALASFHGAGKRALETGITPVVREPCGRALTAQEDADPRVLLLAAEHLTGQCSGKNPLLGTTYIQRT